MPKIKVTVKEIPVRYNGETHAPGKVVDIDDKHFDENLFEKENKSK